VSEVRRNRIRYAILGKLVPFFQLCISGVGAPVTGALGRLISGELPLDDWVALVRATVPPPALWRRRPTPGFWRRVGQALRGRRA